MKPSTGKKTLLLIGLSVLAAACVTVNIYFPAAQVEKTAQEIVDEVYKQGQEQKPKPAPQKKPSSSLERWLAFLGPRPAHAAEATTVSNAAIRGLKEQIAGHHGRLVPHYQAGRVGINNQGMLDIRSSQGLDVKQVAELRRLVSADNQARAQLYQEVAKALNLPADQVAKVQKIFAGQWRDQAGGGWWIQEDNGNWRKK